MSTQFSDLVGKTITKIDKDDYEIVFHCSDGSGYRQYHYQDCCEDVHVEDIAGDLEDIIGTPVLVAEVSSEVGGNSGEYESRTWTFYKIDTVKGGVTIRWLGTSNGYYSERVTFEEWKVA